ncbi:MAG: metal-dependent transcriptional regulator [Candidatus Woesearchaeota archaeon]
MLTRTQEDYLHDISSLIKTKGYARVRDLAEIHNVTPASVSIMMNSLRKFDLINQDSHSPITLTEKGKSIANVVKNKHILFEEFFILLGIPKEIAAKDALKIEHSLHPKTINKIKFFIEHCNKNNLTCNFNDKCICSALNKEKQNNA